MLESVLLKLSNYQSLSSFSMTFFLSGKFETPVFWKRDIYELRNLTCFSYGQEEYAQMSIETENVLKFKSARCFQGNV